MKSKLSILFIIIIFVRISAQTTILAPASPASIPLILLCEESSEFEIEVFTNHTKAHSRFIKGEVDLISTGLAVGRKFSEQKMPITILNSYVSGMTNLVTRDRKYNNFSELKGKKIYVPFKGSPIDEITDYFISEEKLIWGEDIKSGYLVFPSAIQLIKKGKIDAVVLPQPFSTMVSQDKNIFVSIDYKVLWDTINDTKSGYSQVATFAKNEWAKNNKQTIINLQTALSQAINRIKSDRKGTAKIATQYLNFPENIIDKSLETTTFNHLQNSQLKTEILHYYKTIGKPFDEASQDFFYNDKE